VEIGFLQGAAKLREKHPEVEVRADVARKGCWSLSSACIQREVASVILFHSTTPRRGTEAVRSGTRSC
jgi:hypothetical protein